MFETIRLVPWLFGLYLVWLTAGAIDFYLHKKSNLRMTSGVRESALHGAQLGCVGLGVVAWLSFASTWFVVATLLLLAVVHAVMAYFDTSTADGVRRITPVEQHIHSVLDACPWIFTAGLALFVESGWQLEWQPRPANIWIALMGPAALLVVLPWIAEFVAALRFRAESQSK